MSIYNVMEVASSAMRGCIIAAPGRKLVVADLSNIEGRTQAWLAREQWKLQAFRDFDTIGADGQRKGHDLYKLAYAKAFGVRPEDVTKDQRQKGKVMELALGYQGGVGAFVTFALAYGIDLEEMANDAWDALPADLVEEAESFLSWLHSKVHDASKVRVKKIEKTHRKMRDDGMYPPGRVQAAEIEALAVERARLGAELDKAQYGLSRKVFIVCDVFKRAWRLAHPNIAAMWKELENAAVAATTQPGRTFKVGGLAFRRDGAWLRIRLPSGFFLCYPSPEVSDDGKFSYMGVDQYTRKWKRIASYGGKIFENCLAGGTRVVTERGLVPIEQVTAKDRVWDGLEWVSHKGCIYKGKQSVLTAFGVTMTPDHLVLTTDGWKNASSCERYQRAHCRAPDRAPVRGLGRQEVDLGRAMWLWESDPACRGGAEEAARQGNQGLVRLRAAGDDRRAQYEAWHEPAPSLRGLARDARPLPVTDTSGLGQLRRAGHYGLRRVAGVVRQLLVRHGRQLREGLDARQARQREGLFTGELCMAHVACAGGEYPSDRAAGHTGGADADGASRRLLRCEAADAPLPAVSRMAATQGPRAVYDLKDCGPRNRFAVLGDDGQLLIVHNCNQAMGRDVMASNMPRIEAAGYEIVLSVHDELLTETPDDPQFDADGLSALLATVPTWAPGLPLAAAGFEALRYKKE